jgi:hypothetical protein
LKARNTRAREHHAANGREHGQGGGAGAAQLTDHQLALDLQPDHEEKQRHPPIVDPMPHVKRQRPPAQPDGLLGRP